MSFQFRSSSSFANGAEEILRQFPPGTRLTAERITELALSRRVIATYGQTPATTMRNALRADIRKRREQGLPVRFVEHRDGTFSLAQPERRTSGMAHTESETQG